MNNNERNTKNLIEQWLREDDGVWEAINNSLERMVETYDKDKLYALNEEINEWSIDFIAQHEY